MIFGEGDRTFGSCHWRPSRCLNSGGPLRAKTKLDLSTLILEVSRRRSLTRSLSATINVRDDVLSPANGGRETPRTTMINTVSQMRGS